MNTYESKITPYNTGKLKIGEFYVPPFERVPVSREDYMWQNVLLGVEKPFAKDFFITAKAIILNIINK